MPPALRSVMSVMVGFLAFSLISTFSDAIYHSLNGGSRDITHNYLVFRTVMGIIAALVGGFICAVVAGRKPLLHSGVIALILLGFSVNAFYKLQGMFPQWYLLTLTLGAPLAVVLGAALDFPELRKQK